MEVYLYIYSSPHISVRRKSCQRKSSFPQLTLLHLLFSEKLRGMVEAPNFISENNISYCLQRVIQSQPSKTSPSLRKNSRKSPSLARRGILRKFQEMSINVSWKEISEMSINEGNVSFHHQLVTSHLRRVHSRPNFR